MLCRFLLQGFGKVLTFTLSEEMNGMKHTDKKQLLEQCIYLGVWLIIFLAPVVGSFLVSYGNEAESFSWWEVRNSWLATLPFLLLFVANNYLLAPRLLFRKKYGLYALAVVGIVALLFVAYPYLGGHRPWMGFHEFDRRGPGRSLSFRPGEKQDACGPEGEMRPPQDHFREGGRPEGMPDGDFRPDKGPGDFNRRGGERPFEGFKRMPLPIPFISRLAMAFLLVGFNIGISLLFRSLRDEERLKELERERLQSELEYLKYQINPHFFMNTLNNIHALVDIDAKKAQETIVELSKLMRYVLYESSQQTLSLSKEIQFLTHYIDLMKLRYTEKVSVEVRFPGEVPDVQVPPLLFISFVENAFKHGVSYQHESFVQIEMKEEEGSLSFRCTNSSFGKSDDLHHGIGLENIRKRLRLLFGNEYTLSIHEDEARFEVSLIIPLQ